MRLAIGGPPHGPFKITWTEDYLSACGGEAGIGRGTGSVTPDHPDVLEAHLVFECPTTGGSFPYDITWRFHSGTDTLSSQDGAVVTIWRHAGRSESLPQLDLRVNYGHDWVESFHEAGHTVWITVTEEDGETVKATAELVTEPKDFWGGEPGFATQPSDWDPGQPDIQPLDWVYGTVDNAQTARVQIGEIAGTIDLAGDSITGAIEASWFTEAVSVECLDWGSGTGQFNEDGGIVLTNGEDPYSCTWDPESEWDIQPGQDIGVAYLGADSHWVANAFSIPMPTFVAYLPGTIEGYTWPLGDTISLSINGGEYEDDALSEPREGGPEGDTRVLFELWAHDFFLKAGDVIRMTDESAGLAKAHTVAALQVTEVDTHALRVSGIYDPAYSFSVWIGDQVPLDVQFTDDTWVATFAEMPLGAWGVVAQNDEDGDGTSVDFQVPVTMMVTSTADERANDGACTLREAIIAANTNSPSGAADGECPAGSDSQTDTVVLAPDATYSLVIDSTNEDAAFDGDLDIWDNSAALDLVLMVEGGEHATISQDASADDRVLNVMATVDLRDLTLTGGGGILGGGGVQNTGTLRVDTSTIFGNVTSGTGGGLFNVGHVSLVGSAVSGNSAEYGGGIANWGGEVTLTDTSVSGNTASASAGGIHNKDGGVTTIEAGSVISENSAPWDGGGINNWQGTVILHSSTVSANSAGQSGGGILNLADGTVVVDSSSVNDNQANDGGGIANWGGQVSLVDSAVSANDAAWGGGIFASAGALTLEASTVADNTASSGDGGIQMKDGAAVTVRGGSVVSGNSAPNGYGGGISNWGSLLTIDASTVRANSASVSGGGILNKDGGTTTIQNGSAISGNTATYEGGISNWGGSFLTVDGSVISGNSASGSAGGIGNLGTVTMSNSRIEGNSAPWGAGLWNRDGTMTVSASVIYANSAGNGGGGILNWNGLLTVTGSTLRDNSSVGEGDAFYSSVDAPGATTVTGSCIVGNGTTAFFNDFLAVQTATGNWWGDASGPSGAGPGVGDSVGTNIDFTDWLTAPLEICGS
jgi:CSLREA domain-containing protein